MSNNVDKFEFKDFIYLKMDLLESFMAQKHGGFPEKIENMVGNQHLEEKNGEKVEKKSNVNGNVGSKILGINGEYEKRIEGAQINKSDNKMDQGAVTKIPKENMYNKFWDYINDRGLLCNMSKAGTGDYVKLQNNFYYIDFERILGICSDIGKVVHYTENLDQEKFSPSKIQDMNNKIRDIKETLPYDMIMYNEGWLISIDKTWLKPQREHLGYVLNGEFSIVGRVSTIIQINNENNNEPYIREFLNRIQENVILSLRDLGYEVPEKVYIVSPIAIYH